MTVGANPQNHGYAAFFEALLAGKLRFGQTLTQNELSRVLGISISPLRETTTLLEAEGLIEVKRRVGITIFYPDVNFVGSTFQFRALLEREGLRLFASHVTQDWIDSTRSAHHRFLSELTPAMRPKDYERPVKALEDQLHGSFITAFENHQIEATYAKLTQKMFLLRLLRSDVVGPTNTRHSLEEHLKVLDALEGRDPDAASKALEDHLRGVLHRILGR